MTVENLKGIAPAISNRQTKRGFTLTEIAIVLGIIGVILGAIWVAAASVYQNLRVNKAQTELLQISQAVRALYANSPNADAGADMSVTGNTVGVYINAGVFPTDTVVSNTTGSGATAVTTLVPTNPWSGSIYIKSATSTGGTTGDSFLIGFDGIPTSACVDLLMAAAGPNHDSALYSAGATTAGAAPANDGGAKLPFTASVASGSCGATNNDVGFWFKVHSVGN